MSNESNSKSVQAPYGYLWDSSRPFGCSWGGLFGIVFTELFNSVQTMYSCASNSIRLAESNRAVLRSRAEADAALRELDYLRKLSMGLI